MPRQRLHERAANFVETLTKNGVGYMVLAPGITFGLGIAALAAEAEVEEAPVQESIVCEVEEDEASMPPVLSLPVTALMGALAFSAINVKILTYMPVHESWRVD